MNDNKLDEMVWFALSAPHRREMKAKQLLDQLQIENFVPMRYEAVDTAQGKERKLVPAISNLLFARTSKRILQRVKTGVPYLQYKVRPEAGRNVPIVVPEEQMTQFRAVCETRNEHLLFLHPEEINLSEGTPVRILGGAFDGVTGIFLKVSGKQKKRVVVLLEGLVAVATAEISPDLIQVIRP